MAAFHLLMMKAVNWQPRCADLAVKMTLNSGVDAGCVISTLFEPRFGYKVELYRGLPPLPGIHSVSVWL
jgi:hypothetical protein